MARRNAVPVAALAAATLVGLSGFWFGALDVIGYPGRLRITSGLAMLLALLTFSLVGLHVVRKPLPSPSWTTWSLFIVMAGVGYFIARDAFSYALYLKRPGGLPGGCYTQLEVWLKVPRESWVRDAEQIAAVSLFFGSPFVLLVRGLGAKRETVVNGA